MLDVLQTRIYTLNSVAHKFEEKILLEFFFYSILHVFLIGKLVIVIFLFLLPQNFNYESKLVD